MSDAKVVNINGITVLPARPDPDLDIVAQLEKMLDHAKDGRLQAIFVVGWNVDNTIMSGWQGANKAAFTLLGGVEQCKQEMILREFQRRS